MIELQNISKSFHRGEPGEVTALNNISIHIPQGEYVVLIGSNGSGKTTLINVIAGSIQPDSGHVLIGGNDVTRLPEHERSRLVSRIFQNPLAGTAPGLSILENFRLAALRTKSKKLVTGLSPAFRDKVRGRIASLNLGLEDQPNRLMGTLSGGQRQALTLLMAVMDETKVILMDEPASALDPKTADLIMHLAQSLVKEHNRTALLITHHLKDAVKFGDRILQMDDGSIVRDVSGPARSVLQAGDLYAWF